MSNREKKVLIEEGPRPQSPGDPLEEQIRSQGEAEFKKYGISQDDLEKAYDEAQTIRLQDARALLAEYLVEHSDDMLIPQSFTDAVMDLVSRISLSDEKIDPAAEVEARLVAAVFHGNSVYREVRSTFTNMDDTEMPCGTIRAWVIGIVWAAGLAGLNQFFGPRNPSLSVSVYIAQLFSFPMGRLCAILLPTTVYWKGTRLEFTLNPGPFTIKEHMLITIMSNVSTGSVTQLTPMFFQQHLPMFFGEVWAGSWGYQICAILAIQIFGFGLAGMIRRFLIYPPQMIYYFTLSQAALNNALHNENDSHVHGRQMSRFKFFFIVFGAMFVYYWFPNTIFPVLTFFNWMTWIAPKNATLSILTGSYYYNLGLSPFVNSFDWNWFAAYVDPIVNPFFIVFQVVAACFVWAVCVIVPTFFTNTWYTAYLPINSWYIYDNTGQQYSMSAVLGSDGALNQTAYEAYSPVFIPAAYALRYSVLFATLPAVLVFTSLWYGKTLWKITKNAWRRLASHEGFTDVHSRLMARYKEVPEAWYISVGIIGAIFGFVACLAYPTGAPWWTVPVCLVLSIIFIVPIGAVMAVSGYETTLEIWLELFGGYAMKNRPMPFIMFKNLGLSVIQQALLFAQDMKLGHYTKVPPRQMFFAQVVSTIVSCFVVVAIVQFQLGVQGMCNPQVSDHWVCGSAHTNYSSALLWGLLGPQRLFSHVSARYWKIMISIAIGFVWPVLWYLAKKAWPGSVLRYVHPIVLLMGGVLWAPMNLSMFWQSLFFSWIFGHFIKNRYPGWWAKYALVLSSALTAGIAVSALVQFFALTYANVTFPDWWGSTAFSSTCDFQDCRYLTLAEGETFGPTEWH